MRETVILPITGTLLLETGWRVGTGLGGQPWQLDKRGWGTVESQLAWKPVSLPRGQPVWAGTFFGRHIITEWLIFPLPCWL